MAWYNAPVSVPFGNPGYDVGMGGSHDMDLHEPIDTPITALRSGTVVDISSPPWGKQVGIQMDQPVGRVPYYSFLHLDAVNPALSRGTHLNVGDLVGWSGGENVNPGGTAPDGSAHFLNPVYQSSQPQVGISMQYGPVYGSGKGWANPISNYPELNPSALLGGGPLGSGQASGITLYSSPFSGGLPGSTGGKAPYSDCTSWQCNIPFLGGMFCGDCVAQAAFGMQSAGSQTGSSRGPNWTTLGYRISYIVVGLLLIWLGLKHFLNSQNITVNVAPEQQGAQQ